jgi:hypothetical protein
MINTSKLPVTHYESVVKCIPDVTKIHAILDKEVGTDGNFIDCMTQLAKIFNQDVEILPDGMVVYKNGESNSTVHNIIYHTWCMKNSGEHLYYMPKSVVNAFQLTDCNVHSSLIKSPTRSLFIHLEESSMLIDGVNKDLTCRGMYINYTNYDGHPWIHLCCSSGNTIEQIRTSDIVTFFRFPVFEDAKLDSVIDKHFEVTAEMARKNGGSHIDKRDLAAMAKFAVVTLLYLTGQNPDLLPVKPVDWTKHLAKISNPKKRRRFEADHANTSTKRVTIIGNSFKDISFSQQKGSGKFFEMTHKFWVRGHFRMQWYGSELANTRHQECVWIEPFLKGPEQGELITKRFVLAETE